MATFDTKTCLAKNKENKLVDIHVFVHGMVGIVPLLNPYNFFLFMYDDIEETHYQRSVQYIRDDLFLCSSQAMGLRGLRRIPLHFKKKGYGPGALAHAIEAINKECQISQTHPRLYYTFGWSGYATVSARREAGIELYTELKQLTQQLKKSGIQYRLYLYGYSHGGNALLSVAHAAPLACPFFIERAVLLGTPIQCETDYLCQHPIFKKVYNIQSKADFVPTMDCFSFKRFFSGTVMQSRTDFTVPTKVHQVQIRITDIVHSTRSYRDINQTLASFITGNSTFLRDRSPNHTELWFFAWAPWNYRTRAPLRPFCLAAFVPYIISLLESDDMTYNPEVSTVVDLRPYYQETIVRPLYQLEPLIRAPLPSPERIQQLSEAIRPFWTNRLTPERYNRRIQYALSRAQKNMEQEERQQESESGIWAGWSIPFWN